MKKGLDIGTVGRAATFRHKARHSGSEFMPWDRKRIDPLECGHAAEGAVARTALCCGETYGSLGGTSAPNRGAADRRRQAMRLGTRNQAIPQAVRPPEGRAGIPRLVPVCRNAPERVCSRSRARNEQPGRMQSLDQPDLAPLSIIPARRKRVDMRARASLACVLARGLPSRRAHVTSW